MAKDHCIAGDELTFLGGNSQGGSYVLRIYVEKPCIMSFGRFNGGKKIAIKPGDHLYLGSALRETGATSLGRRLVRHATRCGRKRPHPIRELMLAEFLRIGLGQGDLRPKNGKRLHWNVDYLLDLDIAELVAAYVIRSPHRIERELGQLLQNDQAAVVFEPGLGANDVPGNTHLPRIEADESGWRRLPEKLLQIIPAGL